MRVGRKPEVYYVERSLNSESMGDPAAHNFPTAAESPETIFEHAWKVLSRHREAPVAPIQAGGGTWMLTRDEDHRALGTVNERTGAVTWTSFDAAPFGYDKTEDVVALEPYLESGIPQSDTPLAVVMQRDGAQVFSVDEQVRSRRGDPTHRSSFKRTGGFGFRLGS